MATWEVAIAVCDEPEAHRKKEGDIIAFKPAPWNWGRKEIDQYLIVTVEGITQSEMVQLCRPLYEGGDEDETVIENSNLNIIGKRKHKLPLDTLANGWMPTLDLERVRDKKVQYQPLKESGITINATEEVAIFQNKFAGKYKYKDFKVFGDGGEGK